MNSPVANASMRVRSMAAALNCQSKSASVGCSRKRAWRMLVGLLADQRLHELQR
jgi:hypothetical protein